MSETNFRSCTLTPAEFGHRLIVARESRGLDRQTVARRIGVSAASVGAWETRYYPPLPRLQTLCTTYGLNFEEMSELIPATDRGHKILAQARLTNRGPILPVLDGSYESVEAHVRGLVRSLTLDEARGLLDTLINDVCIRESKEATCSK